MRLPGSFYDWKSVWVWTVRTQDAGRVWFTHVWRTHIPGIPGAYASGGVYIYRRELP